MDGKSPDLGGGRCGCPAPAAKDRAVSRLAARQHGAVTRAQLLDLGLGKGAIELRLRAGRLHRVHSGVYLVGHSVPAPRAGEMAAVLACGDGAVVSHCSAAALWMLAPAVPRQGEISVDPVEVTVPRASKVRRPGIKVYCTGSLAPRDVRQVDGIPVTSPARTLLDIAGLAGEEELERAIAEAERRGLARRKQLLDQLERNPVRLGARALRAVLALDGGPALTRSEAEQRLLALLRKRGVLAPEVNARVGRYEVDLLWPGARLVVEVDGFAFHAN
jgi:predicted transcriptional regulator of viral defense system